MNQSLCRRIARLEGAMRFVVPADETDVRQDGIKRVRDILQATGIVQLPTESLAEAFARALGITSRYLRVRLQQGSWRGSARDGTLTF